MKIRRRLLAKRRLRVERDAARSRADPTSGVPADRINELLRAQVTQEPLLEEFQAHFRHFAQHLPGCDEEFWLLLRQWVADLLSRTDRESFVATVPAQAKVLSTLIDLDRRSDADAFVVNFGLDLHRFRTSLAAGGVVSHLPEYGRLPVDLFVLTAAQLTVNAKIVSTRWESGDVAIEGYAFINHIDVGANDTQIRVQLVDSSGHTIDLLTESFDDARIDEHSKHYFADYRPAGFRATSASAVPPRAMTVMVTVTTAGITRNRTLAPLARAPHARVEPQRFAVTNNHNILELEFDGEAPHDVCLVSPRGTLTGTVRGVARIDLDIRGLAPATGTYELIVRDAAGDLLPVWPRDHVDLLTPLARVRTLDRDGRPALRITAPLRVDERGNRNQQRLRDEARVPRASRDAVFFRALYGEVANCNGRAVHQELWRRGTPLQLFWSVRDRSVKVPEGGIAILEGSREWHDVIATARYHMINVHQMDWFHKPEGQVMIQTMHGYPYKAMGHAYWAQSHFPAAQIARFDRRAREWDYMVSPARYATPLLETAFLRPAGAIPAMLEIGYPRNDTLVSTDTDERERIRLALGIRPHQTAILYAPTFRDYVAVDDLRADTIDFFDASEASGELGPDYVFLMRGHPFNARTDQRGESGATVIDMTDYPDINDLCIASDAAILDYSSLRFDYILTGNPMIFLVPDLDRWHEGRGGVIEYAPTAPGPLVTTHRELVNELRDLDRVERTWRDARTTFKEAFVDIDDGAASRRLVDAVFARRGDV